MLDYRLYTFLTLSETLNYTKAAEIFMYHTACCFSAYPLFRNDLSNQTV